MPSHSPSSTEEDEDFMLASTEDEAADEGEADAILTSFRSPCAAAEGCFEAMDQEAISRRVKTLASQVMEVLHLNQEAIALSLLHHFRYNKERLLEAYTSNPQAALASSGLILPLNTPCPDAVHCPICMTTQDGPSCYALGCAHVYCRACWRSYLSVRATTCGLGLLGTTCPAPGCPAIVHKLAWTSLAAPESLARYERAGLTSSVVESPNIKFCPAPGCSRAVRVVAEDRHPPPSVECTCRLRWCFRCADAEIGDHVPASCEDVRAWLTRASSESENIRWLAANTKRCPRCHRPIEKNGGCMHMTCRVAIGGCGHDFCWLCHGPWAEHGTDTGGYYSCNKYTASEARREDAQSAQIKSELDCYMFYYHRYQAHRAAMKLIEGQTWRSEGTLARLAMRFGVLAQDVAFLREAAQQIVANRRVLLWSYVYGFYLRAGDSNKQLYEFLQEDLEKFNEALTRLYERQAAEIQDLDAFCDWRSEVANKTRVTRHFLRRFIQGTLEGLVRVHGRS